MLKLWVKVYVRPLAILSL